MGRPGDTGMEEMMKTIGSVLYTLLMIATIIARRGFSGSRWGASVRRAWAEPRTSDRSRYMPLARVGFTLSRAFSCCLQRPHAASGCLASAATLTNRSGTEYFLAAAHRRAV